MKIGHIHLKIRNMKKSIDFYQRYLGLTITENLDNALVFMSSGKSHHELALQEVGNTAPTPKRHDVGLYHAAFETSGREAFIETYQRLKADGIAVYPVDHRISWALYFSDPDGNGLEVYWDTRDTQHGVAVWEGKDRPLPEEWLN